MLNRRMMSRTWSPTRTSQMTSRTTQWSTTSHRRRNPPARRLRKTDLLRDLRTGQRGVFLQKGQNLPIIKVQFALHN